ncbi:MAG: SH3 domain-containing protein, partial [Bacteroidota bacterium]|nr:SH3 domain-containing protein [Bacteroidota bacterium]
MRYAVCCVPVSPLRNESSHRSEMVTQQLFGEKSIIKESAAGNWVKISLKYDGYEGWVQQSHLAEIDEEHFLKVDKDLTS